jgi:hypothetical protein
MTRATRGGARLGLLLLLGAGLAAGCAHSYDVENRDTPVHVWISAPELAATGGTLTVKVEVAGRVLADGPVAFPSGAPTVELPVARVRTGSVPVAVTVDGGRVRAQQSVGVPNESWIRVVVRGAAVSISSYREQPPILTNPRAGR